MESMLWSFACQAEHPTVIFGVVFLGSLPSAGIQEFCKYDQIPPQVPLVYPYQLLRNTALERKYLSSLGFRAPVPSSTNPPGASELAALSTEVDVVYG